MSATKVCPIDGGVVKATESSVAYQKPASIESAIAEKPTVDEMAQVEAIPVLVSYTGVCATCGATLAWQESFQVLSL